MKNKPLLSICIPTYNREPYLRRLIDSIVSQKEFTDTDDIEIVIDDGPSKDNTEALVWEYREKFWEKIRYFRNSIAIGMCPAFLEAIEFSGGEYTWLFGSDDFMSKEALATTLQVIRTYKPGVILSDRYVFSDVSETNLDIHTNKEDIILNGPKDFFSHLWDDNKQNGRMNGNFFTFISIFCIRQDLYLQNKSEFLKQYGEKYSRLSKNYFNFALIPFFNLEDQKIVIIKNKILVFCQWGNHGWTFRSFEIVKDLYFLIKVLRAKYSIPFKCNIFFNHMLLGWFAASASWVMKKSPILNILRKPLAFIIRPFV